MKPIITRELIATLESHPRTETVYFEKETGLHHFNHAKAGKKKGDFALSINGKEVIAMDRDDVMDADITHNSVVKEGRNHYEPVSAPASASKGGAKKEVEEAK